MKCRNCKNNGFLTDENGTQYSWCEVACDNLDVDEERRCAAFVKATNADRIRAMTDEELAGQIAEWNNGDCPPFELCPKRHNEFTHYIECAPWKCWLDWLEQEVDDADN